jgi:hypothetical protein
MIARYLEKQLEESLGVLIVERRQRRVSPLLVLARRPPVIRA